MKVFRSFFLVFLTFALGMGVASAQSLAEVAKKERKRRDQNKAEAKRVITDRELTTGYGGLPASRSQASASGQSATDEETSAEAETEGEEPEDETKTQAYWQNRVKATKERSPSSSSRKRAWTRARGSQPTWTRGV